MKATRNEKTQRVQGVASEVGPTVRWDDFAGEGGKAPLPLRTVDVRAGIGGKYPS